ncbi:MAG: PEP-CTERM sorting domain-containing protein [Acidobacteriaceae bacterium]|jgi:hypothetical protein
MGAFAVNASPNCQRYVSDYVTTPVRKRVSKATALAWARWRTGHPNWKPNPKVQRPRYVMTTQEAMDKVNFACAVPPNPVITELLHTEADRDGTPSIDPSATGATQLYIPDLTPPEVTEVPSGQGSSDSTAVSWPSDSPSIPPQALPPVSPPAGGITLPPIVPPDTTLATAEVPEPPSLLLVASGIAGCGLFWRRRHASEA